jgi:hypothetical protein
MSSSVTFGAIGVAVLAVVLIGCYRARLFGSKPEVTVSKSGSEFVANKEISILAFDGDKPVLDHQPLRDILRKARRR